MGDRLKSTYTASEIDITAIFTLALLSVLGRSNVIQVPETPNKPLRFTFQETIQEA